MTGDKSQVPTSETGDSAHANTNNTSSSSTGNHGTGSRSIFSVTMDPNALEQELDQAAQSLHSTVNSLLNTMQSSVFGGLETLSREMSAFEKSSKALLGDHQPPFSDYHSSFPWSFRTDGPKKRYRITIEELPPLDPQDEYSAKVFSTTSSGSVQDNEKSMTLVKGASDGEDFTIAQGKAGTADEGKTVITASVAPGLLDWLLFTTHEDSFFRRLGQQKRHGAENESDVAAGAKIQELNSDEAAAQEKGSDGHSKRIVPALVEKVKQVGTHWEKDARRWWQTKRERREEAMQGLGPQHHLFSGTSQNEHDQEEELHSQRWPRGRSWGHLESFSQSTITRPDGTIEHRTVNNIDGETETVVKIQHPDGSVEETVTHENGHHHHSPLQDSLRERWMRRRQDRNQAYMHDGDEDRERDAVAAMVAEAIATERAAAEAEHRSHEGDEKPKSRNWSPKAWIHRQERDE
ncbi:hypothetical protein BG011_008674 [Mortierella polycephala]|uniref:Uncharacterized protein n=1 Tax=Mortierella polycephala TaxID=41804 RepID=A0A9P6PMK2_9FUNG|nr:hypothetical protein BG011_008674 [Mortierella polycephala]